MPSPDAELWADRRSTQNSLHALRAELASLRETVAAHTAEIDRLKGSSTSQLAGSSAPLASSSTQFRWPTPVVLVVATLDGTLKTGPRGFNVSWAVNTSRTTVLLYQRLYQNRPHYVKNVAYEAGVHIDFILRHYDNLPNVTVFMQADALRHNAFSFSWLRCVREDDAPGMYAPLTKVRSTRKDFSIWEECCGGAAVVEQCWRDVLDATGYGWLLADRELPRVKFFPGAQFVASRSQLRRHPREVYAKLHAMAAGGDGRCHTGPLQWSRLNATSSWRAGTSLEKDEVGMTQHTLPGAWEHLHHLLIGDLHSAADPSATYPRSPLGNRGERRATSALSSPEFFHDYCLAFKEDCAGSPCDQYLSWAGRKKETHQFGVRQAIRKYGIGQ